MIVVPNVSIRANYLTIYNRYLTDSGSDFRAYRNNLKEHTNKVKGVLSTSSKKALSNALECLLFSSPVQRIRNPINGRIMNHRISFITLTLPSPQLHCDMTIKSTCLNNFLSIMRQTHYMWHYVWRAEPQKNGNIHFHLATDLFCHMDVIRKAWIDSLELLGYCSRYSPHYRSLIIPCTEIKEIKSLHGCCMYLAEYTSKKNEGRPICGAQWDSAKHLKQWRPPSLDIDSFLDDEIQHLVKYCPDRVTTSDHATMIKVRITELQKAGLKRLSGYYLKSF